MEAINVLIYPLALIVTLGVLVTIHELGHFLVARWAGVKVLRFSVGFGRPLWMRIDRRGTEFAIARIPIGGYVRMLDDRDPDFGAFQALSHERARRLSGADGGRRLSRPQRDVTARSGREIETHEAPTGDVAYMDASVWWRIAIALGGPVANLLLAIIVYWCLFVAGSVEAVLVVSKVDEATPAHTAGLEIGREIVAIDGVETPSWQQLNMGLLERLGDTGSIRMTLREYGASDTTTVELPIERWHQGNDEPDLLGSLGFRMGRLPVVATIVDDGPAARSDLREGDRIVAVDDVPANTFEDWALAVQASPNEAIDLHVMRDGAERVITVVPESREATDGSQVGYLGVGYPTRELRYGPLAAIPRSYDEMVDKTVLTLKLLKKMVVGDVSIKNLSSPIMIAKVAGDSARYGWQQFLSVLALISISLGVLNLLPIPILDGGHVVYCLSEVVTGKPVSERIQAVGAQVGLFLVGAVFLLAVYNDITRFL